MENIQNTALQIYLENLEFFKKNNPHLHDKIISLSEYIDNGEYKERYHLEYIQEDQEFDIFDTVTQTYLYNKQPKKFITEALKNSNLDKVNTIDLLHPDAYNTQRPFPLDPTDNILTKTTKMYHNDIFDFIEIFQKSTVYKYKKFKYIEKFIFVGSLLGSHIEPIVKKLNLKFYLIYEYNLEIFRLSLFVTNYAKLAYDAEHVMLSIMEDKTATEWTLSQFYNHAIRSNYIIKYYCTNYNIHDYFDRILSVSAQRSPLVYSYTKMIEGHLKPNFENIVKYPVLNTIKHYEFLKDKPVLMVAAGPSLGNNIEWLKQNYTKYFVVAIGATIKKLCDHNIVPDLITNADPDEIIENQFPEEIREKIKNIPILVSTATYSKVLEIFNKENIFLAEVMGAYKQNSRTINGYSVGEVTLGFITTLGANEIYLLGTDLALDQETGSTHTDGHQHTAKHQINDEKKELNSFVKDGKFNIASSTLTVKGNLRDKVLTTSTMAKSVTAYDANMKMMKHQDPTLKIYNLCDGAYINETIPTYIKDLQVPTTNNPINREEIIEFLKENSEIGFSKVEVDELLESVNSLNKLIEEIKQIDKQKVKSYNQFIQMREKSLQIINQDLKQHARYYIDRIFLNYFLTIEPYLGYQFNEKIQNEANLVKKVKKAWCKQMLRLAEQYKEIIYSVKDE